ncbi:helix-hairpin-helix domain-containing protein [Alkalihalobacillus hemicellulosilyticus]|uniref:Late competence protein n=1 Tax=Halalkalibacter hemicellulosilyticusJCM 9152 TaxID=1236971 RepID=W4QJ58_9BACI|nr:helix-hairpin-helix domain-containing protein [Halalkalibacter hemicellulosilyticus]GAE31678.1 late competence protein [Halalkalibacter hemicellulosilyticusJCM 9152]
MIKKIQRYRRHVGVGIVVLLSVVLIYLYTNPLENETVDIDWGQASLDYAGEIEDEAITEPLNELIMVDIKGEVQRPNVYSLPLGSRVYEVIELAGGLTKEADERQLNFAQVVEDEMVIYVPAFDELWDPVNIQQANGLETGKVFINTADEKELETLPGIGPQKAAAIIAYREENGPFRSVEELQSVSGIGEKSVERLEGEIDFR